MDYREIFSDIDEYGFIEFVKEFNRKYKDDIEQAQ